MKTTPNADAYGKLLREQAVTAQLDSSRDERQQLRSSMAAGEQATDQLVELEGLHEELLALAQDAYTEARNALEIHRDKLERYDAESERLLAETGGRVRSLEARIRHASGGCCAVAPGQQAPDLSALKTELAVAKLRDSQRVTERLNGREWLARECRASRMAVLTTGQARLALSAAYVPSLQRIQQAGQRAAELHRELLGEADAAGESKAHELHVLRSVTPRSPATLSLLSLQGEPDTGGACLHRDRNGGRPAC